MDQFIPLSVPNFKGKELEYVTKAIETEWVSTSGSYIKEFEEKIAHYLKVDKATACQSGTAAIHLALRLAGVEAGDEVIVPTLTFIAAVNPVKYVGAEPIFMDCDPTLNMDLDSLEKFCREECWMTKDGLVNRWSKKRIKALVVVHVFGNMMNMERVMEIASKYELKVIEDATEALGSYCIEGKYEGRFAGTIGDFGAYSFNGNKIITTGGGGMLVARDPFLVEKGKYLSTQAKNDELYYIHDEIGYNYRMTNIQAAIGIAQLEHLEEFIEIKARNYTAYKKAIDEIKGLRLLPFNPFIRSNHWFYSLVIDKGRYGLSKDQLLKELLNHSIQTRPIWGLIHEQKPYHDNQHYNIINARNYREKVLNIPCSTNLDNSSMKQVVNYIKELGR